MTESNTGVCEWLEICVPHTHRDTYTYTNGLGNPPPGTRVWVPFRNTQRVGIVIRATTTSPYTLSKIKPISSVIDDAPLFSSSLLELYRWVAQYYQAPLSEVIPLALPKHFRLGGLPEIPNQICYQLSVPLAVALDKIPTRAIKQRQLVQLLQQTEGSIPKKILSQAGYTATQIKPLLQQAILEEIVQPSDNMMLMNGDKHPQTITLNPEQSAAVAQILQNISLAPRIVLQGVTGSGKTEVYLTIIAEVLKHGKQVLVLVPEIGLTPQLLARFQARLATQFVVLHSQLNEKERQLAWHYAATGKARIVIGTRSAVFTPLPDLGLIVIDEEHDASLKQLDGVRYSARDTALMRAYKAKIPIILGSATPSLETLYNCQQQRYQHLEITQSALATNPVRWVIHDLRTVRMHAGLSEWTLHRIKQHLDQKNQVLVFINRRGFSPVLLCHQCSWIADCSACDSHLTVHRQQMHQLVCHHCGKHYTTPPQCPKCQSQTLIPVGTGTQRLEQFLQTHFPQTGLIRIDRDEVRKKHAFSEKLETIHSGEAQLIIGTQMMAKGHHFPHLTLVVVVDADAGLYSADYRALERLGQLLIQVGGRAGRADQPGEVILQTHFPKHPLLNILMQQGYNAFAAELLQSRATAQLPPHYFLALLHVQGRHQHQVTQFLYAIKNYLHANLKAGAIEAYGPAPSPLARKAHQHRMQLLFKSASRQHLQKSLTQLRHWIQASQLGSNLRWHLDVDPIDLQ